MNILKFNDFINEKVNKWVPKNLKKGKMHQLLGIKEDEKVEDHFKSGEILAKALLKAVNGDQKKANGMLAIPANAGGDKIYKEAMDYIAKKVPNK
jgi:hypothetical protein